MARLSFRCDDELVERVDQARGGVPRERFLRKLVSDVLIVRPESELSGRPVFVKRGETLLSERMIQEGKVGRSSSEAKRDVRPVPKK